MFKDVILIIKEKYEDYSNEDIRDKLNQIFTLLESRGISATRSPKNRFPDERFTKVVISLETVKGFFNKSIIRQ